MLVIITKENYRNLNLHVGENVSLSQFDVINKVEFIQFDGDEMNLVSFILKDSIQFPKSVGYLVGDLAKTVLLNWK